MTDKQPKKKRKTGGYVLQRWRNEKAYPQERDGKIREMVPHWEDVEDVAGGFDSTSQAEASAKRHDPGRYRVIRVTSGPFEIEVETVRKATIKRGDTDIADR